MQKHAIVGAEIIGEHDDPMLTMARSVALSHHEKWDGSGYPFCLKADAIPMAGRIVAIADVFDALTSQRPYKKAWSTQAAVDLIVEQGGKHFDPELIATFMTALPDIQKIQVLYEEEAVVFAPQRAQAVAPPT